ncbi:hypothetical protein J5X84_07680 [Streptosporangiaceae bacterium NEAU-GS5]|nr:hypothetical protein [Streptosporangiaceae bacterium NEAU-GS5]
MTTPIEDLHATLDSRARPEDVADLVLQLLGDRLDPTEKAVIERAAWLSVRREGFPSSMSTQFARPVGGASQVEAAARLFERPEWIEVDTDDPHELLGVAGEAGAEIGWVVDHRDFKADRLDREARAGLGLDLSKRQYNRRFRALGRLADKADRLSDGHALWRLVLIGRSGFASTVPFERFSADPYAAAFIAYFTARRNMRREFSLSGRENPFDEIAQILLARCEASPSTDWPMIALAYGKPAVLARLDDAQRGELLGRWSAMMRECAERLERLWTPRPFDRTAMIVRRGDDSSTWNTVAQAYNAARAGWLACLQSMAALHLLDAACPGKVMRLMAADLAQWHKQSGAGVDPDTKVWAALPPPWDVLAGRALSTRADVTTACRHVGLDPLATGWLAPTTRHAIAAFRPTPELVHGVTIADPVWAGLLRRAGVFSGKRIKPELAKDATHGLAAGVVTSDLPIRPEGG